MDILMELKVWASQVTEGQTRSFNVEMVSGGESMLIGLFDSTTQVGVFFKENEFDSNWLTSPKWNEHYQEALTRAEERVTHLQTLIGT